MSEERAETLRTDARNRLLNIIDSVQAVRKGIVFDPSLSGPLSQLVEFSTIKEQPLDTDCTHLLFFTRPSLLHMKHITGLLHLHIYSFGGTIVCEQYLEEHGVLGDLVISEYPLGFLPLEYDLLSLELNSSFTQVFLKNDITVLQHCVLGLTEIERIYGRIPHIRAKGKYAKSLVEVFNRLSKKHDATLNSEIATDTMFNMLVVVDRTVDLLSPLHTQLTYSGLLDEFYGIKNGYIDVDAALVSSKQTTQKTRKVKLNGEDALYAELRDLNFASVGTTLNRIARAIKEDYNERHQAKTVTQIRDFVSKLGHLQNEHQSLRIHINLAEELWTGMNSMFSKSLEIQQNLLSVIDLEKQNEGIEELILRGATLETVLRLICIESLVYGGLKPKTFDHFKQLLVDAYGYGCIETLYSLEQLGLLSHVVTKSSFIAMRNAFSLIVEDINEQEPNDIAYVYSGYAPLSVRLIEMMADTKWKQWDDVNKFILGPHVDQQHKRERGKLVCILFLGGVTYAEVSALRYLNTVQQDRDGDNALQYMVLTTQMLNGQDMVTPLTLL